MRNYEIMYILKADLDEAAREAEMNNVQALLEKNGAKVNNTDTKMGLRELAYEIKDQTKGFYVVLKVSAETARYKAVVQCLLCFLLNGCLHAANDDHLLALLLDNLVGV